MALMKLTVMVETAPDVFGRHFRVLFNPDSISIRKSTNWKVTPKLETDTSRTQFTYGDPAILTVELFFDTYEQHVDVRRYTDEIYALTTIQKHGELHRPPLCRLEWGNFNLSETCAWVLEDLSQQFTLFLPQGTPVRARLNCTFKQWRGDAAEAQLLNKQSSDVHKARVVRAGDTLSAIAGQEFNDDGLWRAIASANGIDNPRKLVPGTVLDIPVLAPPSVEKRHEV
jgi:nucleoid-associated protein YgaU